MEKKFLMGEGELLIFSPHMPLIQKSFVFLHNQ